jgi:hypothetical protein
VVADRGVEAAGLVDRALGDIAAPRFLDVPTNPTSPSARRRVEHCRQWMWRERKCSEPSSAIGTRPPGRRRGASSPLASKPSTMAAKSGSRCSGGAPSSIWRQHLADVVVARDRRQAEQGVGVRAPARRRHGALVGEKGRALHEEHRERRERDIRHAIAAVAPGALVRQPAAALAQRRDMAFEPFHTQLESQLSPCAKRSFPQNESCW